MGSKHHLLVDRNGIPLNVALTAANMHDSRMLESMLDTLAPIKVPRGRPRRRPHKLHADKAYNSKANRLACRLRSVIPRIARKGIESRERLGRFRWVVERTFSWLSNYRRLSKHYEYWNETAEAMIHLAMIHVMLRRLTNAQTEIRPS